MDPFPFEDYAYLDFFFKDLEIVSYVRDVKFGVMDLLGLNILHFVVKLNSQDFFTLQCHLAAWLVCFWALV